MPCVLENLTHEELDKWWDSNSNPLSPAPLFIRYQCGFVPIGIFPALIANLAGMSKLLELIVEGIKKNRVQFRRLGGDYDTVTLISQSKYYAVHITRSPSAQTSTHEACSSVRELFKSTLKEVTSRMNYSFSAEYQLSFECPSHPGREHLCVVDSKDTSPHVMCCLKNADCSQPLEMQNQHMIWFKEVSTGAAMMYDCAIMYCLHFLLQCSLTEGYAASSSMKHAVGKFEIRHNNQDVHFSMIKN